jgi:hypothetical protein
VYNINKDGEHMKDIEKLIGEVNGTMAMEGMPLTDDDKNRIRTCLRDEDLYRKTLKELITKHSKVNSYEQRI